MIYTLRITTEQSTYEYIRIPESTQLEGYPEFKIIKELIDQYPEKRMSFVVTEESGEVDHKFIKFLFYCPLTQGEDPVSKILNIMNGEEKESKQPTVNRVLFTVGQSKALVIKNRLNISFGFIPRREFIDEVKAMGGFKWNGFNKNWRSTEETVEGYVDPKFLEEIKDLLQRANNAI
jgi:hypothetical protein